MADPRITPSTINEYVAKESDPRWYFSLIGDLAATEPYLHGWISDLTVKDLIHEEWDLPAPVAIHMQVALRRMFIRGIYFGKRHEMGNWEPKGLETPLTDKINDVQQKPRVEGDMEAFGEQTGIEESDYL